MEQVRGHKEWWKFETLPVGSALFRHFHNGKESKIFISKEDQPYRRMGNFKYEIFESGCGIKGSAGYIRGCNTLKEAIEKADNIIKAMTEQEYTFIGADA